MVVEGARPKSEPKGMISGAYFRTHVLVQKLQNCPGSLGVARGPYPTYIFGISNHFVL